MSPEAKKKFLSLEWKSFSTYPTQGIDIILHAKGEIPGKNEFEHKFFKISKFNAVTFDVRKIISKEDQNRHWDYTWYPVNLIPDDFYE